jgi:hypothetical protein
MEINLEKVDDVPGKCELAVPNAIVVSARKLIIGRWQSSVRVIDVFPPDFRPEENRCSNPVSPAQQMLRVPALCAGALTSYVIKYLSSKRNVVMRA